MRQVRVTVESERTDERTTRPQQAPNGWQRAESEAESMAWERAQAQAEDYAYEDEQGEHRNFRLLLEILETAVLTLLLFMVVRLTVQNFKVDGPSMMPTLQNSEYILVDKAEYYLHAPRRGDVIVFVAPPDTSTDYVKRIIGLPGDSIRVMQNGVVYVNGVRINEPYVNDLDNPYGQVTYTLKTNQYFVLGDNRGDSSDSRAWGPVPRSYIIGKAALVYWPVSDVHLLQDWSNVFNVVR
jgi:signal peptidase I